MRTLLTKFLKNFVWVSEFICFIYALFYSIMIYDYRNEEL